MRYSPQRCGFNPGSPGKKLKPNNISIYHTMFHCITLYPTIDFQLTSQWGCWRRTELSWCESDTISVTIIAAHPFYHHFERENCTIVNLSPNNPRYLKSSPTLLIRYQFLVLKSLLPKTLLPSRKWSNHWIMSFTHQTFLLKPPLDLEVQLGFYLQLWF